MHQADVPVVLVTGAARRIGACIVRRFHAHGYRVLIHYNHSASDANTLAAELNGQRSASAATLQAELTDQAAVSALGPQALACFGRVDVLVNNASSFYATEFGDSSNSQWDDLIDSNLRAAYFLSQALAEELRGRGGAIVNIVDSYADSPLRHYPIYSIAKAGLKAMTRSLAKELAPQVRVNGVSPGAIIWPDNLADDSDPQVLDKRAAIIASIPLARTGAPEDIADLTLFLATQASYVTGQVLRVDGGRNLSL